MSMPNENVFLILDKKMREIGPKLAWHGSVKFNGPSALISAEPRLES